MHSNTVPEQGHPVPFGGFVPAPGHSTVLQIPRHIGDPEHYQFKLGQTVAEIAVAAVGNTSGLCAEIWDGGKWTDLPREWWVRVKPKAQNVIRFVYRMHGGDGAGSIFAIVAAVATFFVAGPLGGSLAAATGLSVAAATAVTTVALNVGFALLGSVLFPPSTGAQSKAEQDAATINSVEAEQNVLAVGGYLPFVAGYSRITPPEVMQPLNYIDQGKQFLERNFALEGHHILSDIEGDETPLPTDLTEIQTRDGQIDTTTNTFLTRVGKTIQVGKELTNFRLDDEDAEDQKEPNNSLPQPVQFTSTYIRKLDEISFRLTLQALISTKDDATKVSLPVRVEMRPKGTSTWMNLPEIHLQAAEAGEIALDVRFRWLGAFQDALSADDIDGAVGYRFWANVPGYDGATEWTAHSQFNAGSGAQDIENIAGFRNGLQVRLNETDFPRGEYEFRVTRGLCIETSDVSDTYGLPNSTDSLFAFEKDNNGDWTTYFSQSEFPVRISVGQCVSISDQRPVQKPGVAQIAARTKESVLRVTCLAAGVVPVWDGSNWTTKAPSKRPADHLRALVRAEIDNKGIDARLVDDASMEAWHNECVARDYQVSTVLSGESWTEQAQRIASAGFARFVYTGNGYGVDYFRDRSGELPVMTFTGRNGTKITLSKRRIERPPAFRCRFKDEEDGYREREIVVQVPFQSTHPKQASETFENVSREIDVRRQILFQMWSLEHQSIEYQIDTSLEGSKLREGSLIGVATDLLTDYEHGFRVSQVIDDQTLVLDHAVPVEGTTELFSETNIFTPEDIFAVGGKSEMFLITKEGPERRYVTQVADRTVRLDTPLSTAHLQKLTGTHVSIVPEDSMTFRALVTKIDRGENHAAKVFAVPEAPIIHNRMVELFG